MKRKSIFLVAIVLILAFLSLSVLSGCATRTYEKTFSRETNKFLKDVLRQGGKEIRKEIYD
ncbi:MAG: hypothetical protein U9M90_04595 [Patescibacteria group bacterium]|nr:hypothetical protein [Patescibacteria group bacterium]